ncbi:SIR2 family protein [Anaerovibrio lipolyticus]|uniref:SIR2 family protein n=1 Tax=Anaerovibrio lipolyticus TaxID=82374 RepID=UPI000489835A|nr:SIR2 family protein [Anaerovibrio lipolyticus]
MERFQNISYFRGKNKKIIDLECLKNEVAQFLQLDNLNFFLGAGCSSHIVNNKEQGIPGMATLYKGFFEENPGFTIAESEVEHIFEGNLEKMLETMGAIYVAGKVKSIEKDIENKICMVQKFIRRRITEGLHGAEVLRFYHNFYLKTVSRGRKNPINIFTTNYDLYNEQALDSLSFPYNNGFIGKYKRSFNPVSYKYAYVENMNISKNVWERVPNFYNLYKIHGSISWIKKDNKIYEIDCEHINDDETVMIYPTPLKDRTTLMTPYSDLFRAMETALLKKNSVLITLGYSFGDDHINRLILNSLAIPTFKLVVFGQSDAISKLIEMNDSRIIVINSEDKIHYFKNFVEKVMPDVQTDIKEQIELPMVSDLIKVFEGAKNE